MSKERPQVIAVMGPTAVGKTDLVLELAKYTGGEIVNADSVQIYRFLDIGTAKPTPAERAEVPHHLLDVVNPDEDFDAYRYSKLARAAIESLALQGRPALLVGGTGLYLKAAFHGLFLGTPGNRRLRQRLRREAERDGSASLYQRLAQVDPVSAHRLHPHDLFRIIRALEVWECSGKPLSLLQKEHDFREQPFRTLKIGLHCPRSELYERIDRRVESMVEQGLVEEVKALLESGYGPDLKSMRSLGYRHVVQYLMHEVPLAETLRTMKRDTRHYAKRQMTWFRRDPEIDWFRPDEVKGICRRAKQFLNQP